MSEGLTIREASIEDAATIATLFSEFNALLGADGLPEHEAFLPENANISAESMTRRLEAMRDVEGVWLAEVDGTAAALMCLRLIPYIGQEVPYAELTQLYVREAFQRQGIGAALIAMAEHAAKQAGATCLHILTGAHNNEEAQAFYRAQGYAMPGVEFVKFFSRETASAR
jgi:GNAT superfamily N-acetyltransferase